ncbi:LysR family transcriptional regulator [Streptomyces sp. NPDC047014]|uniref:LysR family transcriptional regulator n=1 Tax=Streptomyces sp. NPDC047014 TaxID=3155736 RepID=UPI0033EC7CE6
MIDVQRLRVLRAVAEHGSFNKAAAALLLTPSAVSQHIAALERTLGHPVAVRSTRGVTLTEPGRLLVETAETISAELDRVRGAIAQLTAERPRLTIATFTSGGRRLLPAALSRFVAAHPEVELTVREAEPEDAVPLVRHGHADLALTYHFDGPPPVRPAERPPLTWLPLREDPLWLVLPSGHPLAACPSLELGELATERWVLGCLKTEAYLRRYAHQAGFDLQIGASTTDYFFAQSLVAAGVGVSLVPEVALAPTPHLSIIPTNPPRPARHIGLVLPHRRTPHAEAMATALTEAARATGTGTDVGTAADASAHTAAEQPKASHR